MSDYMRLFSYIFPEIRPLLEKGIAYIALRILCLLEATKVWMVAEGNSVKAERHVYCELTRVVKYC